jgi:Na+/melibiose symporter-like transporter
LLTVMTAIDSNAATLAGLLCPAFLDSAGFQPTASANPRSAIHALLNRRD